MRIAVNNPNQINIIERMPESNFKVFAKMQYDNKFISEDLWNTYKLFYEDFNNFFIDPDVIVYLKTTPDFCFKRKNERRSPGEELISYEYLVDLHNRYEDWIKTKNNVYTVEVDKNFSKEEINEILNCIIKRIKVKKVNRISKQEGYLEIAKAVSLRSTCMRRRYGSVIVSNDEVVGIGYNGSSRGEPNCIDSASDYCIRKRNNIPAGSNYELCHSLHSEQNAIISAGRKLCMGSTLYLYGFDIEKNEFIKDPKPCLICEKMIKNSGIKKLITHARTTQITRKLIFSGGHE
jgi:dCMP deaminase